MVAWLGWRCIVICVVICRMWRSIRSEATTGEMCMGSVRGTHRTYKDVTRRSIHQTLLFNVRHLLTLRQHGSLRQIQQPIRPGRTHLPNHTVNHRRFLHRNQRHIRLGLRGRISITMRLSVESGLEVHCLLAIGSKRREGREFD